MRREAYNENNTSLMMGFDSGKKVCKFLVYEKSINNSITVRLQLV